MNMVGVVVYKWAIISIISMLTVDGLGALITSRLPKASSLKDEVNVIAKQASNGMCLLVIILIFWISVDGEYSLYDGLFAASWFVYGLTRKVLIISSKYVYLLLIETGGLVFAIYILSTYGDWLTHSSVGMIFVPIGVLSAIVLFRSYGSGLFTSIRPSFELVGVKFGMVNLLSGGVGLLLIPVLQLVYGSQWIGYIGLVLSILNLIFLVPRAMAQLYVPKIACLTGENAFMLYKKYRMNLNITLVASLIMSPVVWLLSKDIYFNVGDSDSYLFIYIVMYFSVVAGQFSLAPSNYFMINEQPKFALRSTYIHVCIVTLVLLPIFYGLIPNATTGIVTAYLLLLISNVIRFLYLSFAVQSFEKDSAKSNL